MGPSREYPGDRRWPPVCVEQTVRLDEPVVGGLLTGSGDLPRQLEIELPRLRLVELLTLRWCHPVTLLVAGAGFGKTTVLAQAVRAHLLAPRGIDAWVSCTALHG